MYLVSVVDGANNMVYRTLINCIIGNNANLSHILDKCVKYCKNDHTKTDEEPYHTALHYKVTIFGIEDNHTLYKDEPIFNERFLRTFKGILSILQKTDILITYKNSVSTYIELFFHHWFKYLNDHDWHMENSEDFYQYYIYPAISNAYIKYNYDTTTHIYRNGAKFSYDKFTDTVYKLYQKEDKNKTLTKEKINLIAKSTYASMCDIPELVIISKEY